MSRFFLLRAFFDVQTFSGFYCLLLIQCITSFGYFALYALMPLVQIGFCTYMKACATDFKAIMKDVAEYINHEYGENDFRVTDSYIRNYFKDAVGFHVGVLR